MSLFGDTIAYLLSLTEDGEGKAELAEKLHCWFGGKEFDLDSALEWIKNKRCLTDIQKALIGASICFLKPKDQERKRRFITEPLSGMGTTATKKKGLILAEKKMRRCVSFHEAFEIAEGHESSALLYCLMVMYLNPGNYSMQVKLGTLCALCEKQASHSHRAHSRAARSSVPGVRREMQMVSAMNTAKTMNGMGKGEDVQKLAEELQSNIGVLRSLGASQKNGEGIAKDVMEVLKQSSMGNSALVKKYL
ncbi:matrix protein 1 [Influenza B virus]|uniref:Matrix protein 1 n=4 Tax=Influenza B virus TaxID=11520 RepID=A0A4Y5WNG3_9INFB|nr:matrix protein 1 [Influenza B virus (B/Hong Kong/22/1989)]AGX24789.1 matrix protein 1 [Influenza B virus (B/Victoria/230/2008)]ANW74011.1 matrix protein 1 [Influenza B virus (B/Maine/11/2016)]QDE09039.1 matrix protein 1 [Influenza B virus]QDJ74463.1 matrix protein 1 [Influenza B virus]